MRYSLASALSSAHLEPKVASPPLINRLNYNNAQKKLGALRKKKKKREMFVSKFESETKSFLVWIEICWDNFEIVTVPEMMKCSRQETSPPPASLPRSPCPPPRLSWRSRNCSKERWQGKGTAAQPMAVPGSVHNGAHFRFFHTYSLKPPKFLKWSILLSEMNAAINFFCFRKVLYPRPVSSAALFKLG